MRLRGLMLLNPRDPWFINPPAHTFSYVLITNFSWCIQEQQDHEFTQGKGCLVSTDCRFAKATPEHHSTLQFALIYYAISSECISVHYERQHWQSSVFKADFVLRHLNNCPGFLHQFQEFYLKMKVTSTDSQCRKSQSKTTKLWTMILKGWLSCSLIILNATGTEKRLSLL